MYSYDAERDILGISQIPYRQQDFTYKSSYMYDSYMQYLKKQVFLDISRYVIEPLNEELSKARYAGGVDGGFLQVARDPQTGAPVNRSVEDDPARVMGREQKLVKMSLTSTFYSDVSKPFTVLRIPMMDKYGVIHRRKRGEALIASIVQSDDITFDNNELKVITKEERFINIIKTASGPKMVFGKEKYDVGEVIIALATEEGLDVDEVIKQMQGLTCMRSVKPETWEQWKYYALAMLQESVLKGKLQSTGYSLSVVRERLNDVLSLQNRALGEKLDATVVRRDGTVIARAGDVVTKDVLNDMALEGITICRVEDIPNLTGLVLAEPVMIFTVRKGSEIIEEVKSELQQLFPDCKGRYINKTILDVTKVGEGRPIIISAGTEITMKMLQFMVYNGVEEVTVESGGKSTQTVNLFREVIGNRSVLAVDRGCKPSENSQYVYIDSEGNTDTRPREYLTASDLLAMLSLFESLIMGKELGAIASKDLGFRKKVLLAQELFSKAMKIAGKKFVIKQKRQFADALTDTSKVTADMREAFKDGSMLERLFYGLSLDWWQALRSLKVVQDVDYTNPLAFYSSLEKINTITKDKHSITEGMRSMTLGHIGRLCPYEIPSGGKLGVVNTKTPLCKIENGILKTPYYKVLHVKGKTRLAESVTYLSIAEEEQYRIGDILSLHVDERGYITNTDRILARIPVRDALEKMAVEYVDIAYLDYVSVDPQQNISLACSIIPFMGADDAARVTFEISMSKQAKALPYSETPIVLTSAYYDVPRKSPYFMIHAEYDGVVEQISSTSIIMRYDGKEDLVSYPYRVCEVTHASVILRQVEVIEGQRVTAGTILVSSNFVKDGLLAMGRNVLVGYIPVGYNYEDGVYASERLRHDLTSYTPEKESTAIPKAHVIANPVGISKLKYIRKGDSMFTRFIVMGKGNAEVRKPTKSKQLQGFITDVDRETDPYTKKSQFVTSAVELAYMIEGDKIANRHGNKGVSPALRPASEMPAFANGEFLDVVYNPAGVASRMNIGQVLECNLGLAGYILRTRFRSDSFNGATAKDVKRILQFTWALANEDDAEEVIQRFPEFPLEWRRKRLEHIEWIRSWKSAFNEDGTAYLYNPRTGKMYQNPVVVGVNYIHKLVQEIAHKFHARSGYLREDYVKKTSAPTEGAANGGGQRMGEMEIAALAAYGASAYVQELLNDRGDNPVARCNMTSSAIYGPKRGGYSVDNAFSVRRSTEEFVSLMEVLGIDIGFSAEDSRTIPVGTQLDGRRVYTSTQLLSLTPNVVTGKSTEEVQSYDDFHRMFTEE